MTTSGSCIGPVFESLFLNSVLIDVCLA